MCGSRRPNRLRFGPCSTRIFSGAACRSIPVPLEVGYERGAEVAVRLLAGVHRHVAPEGVERLLAGAERAAVAGGAHHSGAGETLDYAVDGMVHFRGSNHFVADHVALGARAVD